jgi:hypothetical protein
VEEAREMPLRGIPLVPFCLSLLPDLHEAQAPAAMIFYLASGPKQWIQMNLTEASETMSQNKFFLP